MNSKLDVKVDPLLAEANASGANVKAGGFFIIEHIRNGKVIDTQISKNIVVDEGLTHILNVALSGGAQDTTWFVGIFKNNHVPVAGDIAATFAGAGVAGEVSTEVDETTRPAWTEAGVSAKAITNSASPATFTANTTVSVWGAFLISDNVMGGTTGTLMAASRFTSVRNLLDTDVLNITYTLTIADA